MKLASFEHAGQALYGTTDGETVTPVTEAFRIRFPDLRSVLSAGALDVMPAHGAAPLPLSEVTLLPPVPNPAKIVCVGLNYPKPYPVDGAAPPTPTEIVLFGKERQCLVGHGAALEIPPGPAAESFDYEAEIAMVIGRAGRCIPPAQAMAHVAGFTAFNDGSVRDWQRHSVYAGKNFERSGACGPWITTADEIADPSEMRLTARLNGAVVQDAHASEMIFGLAAQIAYVSTLMTVQPGDIIATGSPDGTGGSRTPKRFLRAGDRLDITVSGVGCLSNTVGATG
jgi:2-keto-4-pentenoate hydratase/2-oxohepta-3-ene-1,7-dioic acid hydratase in catechol pathway